MSHNNVTIEALDHIDLLLKHEGFAFGHIDIATWMRKLFDFLQNCPFSNST